MVICAKEDCTQFDLTAGGGGAVIFIFIMNRIRIRLMRCALVYSCNMQMSMRIDHYEQCRGSGHQ